MPHRSSLAMLLAVVLATPLAAIAESRPIELKWSELGSRIQGRDIDLVLPDGTALRGEVETVREGELVLNVKKTSNSRTQPKGNAVIPRTSVSILSLQESRGKWGRSVGVVRASRVATLTWCCRTARHCVERSKRSVRANWFSMSRRPQTQERNPRGTQSSHEPR